MSVRDDILTRARNLERYPFESATMAEAGRLAAKHLREAARDALKPDAPNSTHFGLPKPLGIEEVVAKADDAIRVIADGNFYEDYDASSSALGDLRQLRDTILSLKAENDALREAGRALIADVRRRYPGEELRCEYMRALDAAQPPSQTPWE